MMYLDYHATTPCDRRIADRIYQTLTENFGNANSTDHAVGDRAAQTIKEATNAVANLLNTHPKAILFTSGATESLNLAIQGTLNAQSKKQEQKPQPQFDRQPRIAISPVEHSAVLDLCHALQKQGRIELLFLQVDRQANLDIPHLEQTCASGLDLLCVMAANNEVGTLVLTAMGLPDEVIEGALRISLGKFTTDDEVEQAAALLADAAQQIRRVMG